MRCDLELEIEQALIDAGIKFKCEQRLDFFLPDFNVYVEVKKFHSDRSASQLASQDNVILVQGRLAVKLFCSLLKRNTTV